jgi:geranylgeranyl diphosphate synthase type I
MTTAEITEELRALLEAELNGIVSSRDMPLYGMMSYHMGWTDSGGGPVSKTIGDRAHGLLCLLACHAAGGDIATALPAAAAVELVENFCRIHDDVQAGNPRRDNRDSVWWVWGPAQAINAGDGMHALARLALFRLTQAGVPPTVTVRAFRLLDEASLRACEGRFLDLEAQEKIDLGIEAYKDMAHQKTGSLFSCSMNLGALVATYDEDDNSDLLEAMATCGANLGVALQMHQDLLQLWGDDDGDVPDASPDAMNKKKLLPVVYAFDKASVGEKRRMGEIFFKRVLEPDDVAKLRGIIEGLGVREECGEMVNRYRSRALEVLESVSLSSDGKKQIQQFADDLLK